MGAYFLAPQSSSYPSAKYTAAQACAYSQVPASTHAQLIKNARALALPKNLGDIINQFNHQ